MTKQVRAGFGLGNSLGGVSARGLLVLGLVSCAGSGEQSEPAEPASQPSSGELAAPSSQVSSAGNTRQAVYKPDEVLVRFKRGVGQDGAAAVHAKHDAQIIREYRIPSNLQLVRVPAGSDIARVVDDYRRDPDVLYVEPNYFYQLSNAPPIRLTNGPNDPRLSEQWSLRNPGLAGADIHATEAWNLSTGSDSVVIGVLDTGIDYNHQDLAANVLVNPGEIAGNGIDDDHNGWIDDIHGIDAIAGTGDPMDRDGHGTHVSGTIAARGDNGIGIAGVAWNAKLVSCRAFAPAAALGDVVACMDYFLALKTRASHPVNIVATNNSWVGTAFSESMRDAIAAQRDAGMVFIAAAGNAGADLDATPQYPASYELANIISVMATDQADRRASFSNFGAHSVDIGAPGENVLSTLPGNQYGARSGTSVAAPHVTGLVALLVAQDPMRTASQVKNLILAGGDETIGTTGNALSGRRVRADGSLGCEGRVLATRVSPAASNVVVAAGTSVPLRMLNVNCATPITEPLSVTVVETGETIELVDQDGSGELVASYLPQGRGKTTLRFPNGELVGVNLVSNYDQAREVAFEFPQFTGTTLPISCDFCFAAIESPFPIRFGGDEAGFNTVHVISKGVISFDPPVFFGFDNLALPSTAAPTIVSPFWDDLVTATPGASVRWIALGNAPERRLVIEYREPRHFGFTGGVTFQVVFFENSPNIQFNYLDVNFGVPTLDAGLSQTVGVQVAPGLARQFSFNTANALRDNLSLLWTQGAPIANAGPDQVVEPLADVQLDGRASRDDDGEIVAYSWTQIAGVQVALNNADTATPFFTAPFDSGTLTFRLEVTDNEGEVGSDTVNVTVNRPPVAGTNADFEVATNLVGTLDGTSSSDPDGTVVGFAWRQVSGDRVTVQNPNSPIATFVAPPDPGFLVFELTVTDEDGFTDTELIVVNVFLNFAPIADAGENRIVRPGSTVTLDGTGSSDVEGPIAAYAWTSTGCVTLAGTCTITLTGADTATPSFVAPSVPSLMSFRLTVTDRAGATATDTVTLAGFIQGPTAVVSTQTACVQNGERITLDGSQSSDPDGSIATYSWLQLAGPEVVVSGADSAQATFIAPSAGTLVFELTVTDIDGLTATTQIALAIDQPPSAQATATPTVTVGGSTVALDGSRSLDAAAFSWRQTAGTPTTLSDASSPTPTFVAQNPTSLFEAVTFELTVTDECGATASTTVSVIVIRI